MTRVGKELDKGINACVLTFGFLVAAVGFLGVFPAITISESECEDGKKAMYLSQPCVVRGDGSSEEGTWTTESRGRLTGLYASRRQGAVPSHENNELRSFPQS